MRLKLVYRTYKSKYIAKIYSSLRAKLTSAWLVNDHPFKSTGNTEIEGSMRRDSAFMITVNYTRSIIRKFSIYYLLLQRNRNNTSENN